jgi:hypothetical protein
MKWQYLLIFILALSLLGCNEPFIFDSTQDLGNLATVENDLSEDYVLKLVDSRSGEPVLEEGYYSQYHIEFQTKAAKTVSEYPSIEELAINSENPEEIINGIHYVTTEVRSYIDENKLAKDINDTWRRANYIGGITEINSTQFGDRTVTFTYKAQMANYSTVLDIYGLAFVEDNLFVYIQTSGVENSLELTESLAAKIEERITLVKQ